MFVLIFVAILVGAILFIILIKFNYNSVFGKDLRSWVLRFPEVVTLLNLNQPGDNRMVYLSTRYEPLKVSIFYVKDMKPEDEMTSWLADTISETTGKVPQISPPVYLSSQLKEYYTDADLNTIRKSLPDTLPAPAELQVVYLPIYEEDPTYLGVTLHRDTIFIFKKQLLSFQERPAVLKLLERSTLMHEWGHLLGLGHVKFPGCIMSKDVEIYTNRWLKEAEVPVSHCQDTFFDLKALQQIYQ